ncbi:MAG TPA: cytochrome c oxidase assembly protein [Gammaproteobacteria bacterium]|jgi:cytochrome c oxidase assembly protein subunit 11|nr:cytochrome c oxidase assembly protein [Gammaproteobacteria bacterium]
MSKSRSKVLLIGGIAAIVMFGFTFAMVPLYSLICKKTGLSTVQTPDLLTQVQAADLKKAPDLNRIITVQFVAVNHNGMPWDFYPLTRAVKVHPGESAKVNFYAKNTTSRTMTVQAIPSMTPNDAVSHFHKIECFCFHQQTLSGKASKKMALIFQIDRDIPKEIHVITLAYTLFDVAPQKVRRS